MHLNVSGNLYLGRVGATRDLRSRGGDRKIGPGAEIVSPTYYGREKDRMATVF